MAAYQDQSLTKKRTVDIILGSLLTLDDYYISDIKRIQFYLDNCTVTLNNTAHVLALTSVLISDRQMH